MKIVPAADDGPPTATRLTATGIVMETHRLCRPVKLEGDGPVPVTLPDRVARMYLDLAGEWNLSAARGHHDSPSAHAGRNGAHPAEGYDPMTQPLVSKVPALSIPDQPRREEAEAALGS